MTMAEFQKMRFKPGKIDGFPVKAWVDIVIQFKDDTQQPEQPLPEPGEFISALP
jgi:hypothetical protein